MDFSLPLAVFGPADKLQLWQLKALVPLILGVWFYWDFLSLFFETPTIGSRTSLFLLLIKQILFILECQRNLDPHWADKKHSLAQLSDIDHTPSSRALLPPLRSLQMNLSFRINFKAEHCLFLEAEATDQIGPFFQKIDILRALVQLT